VYEYNIQYSHNEVASLHVMRQNRAAAYIYHNETNYITNMLNICLTVLHADKAVRS